MTKRASLLSSLWINPGEPVMIRAKAPYTDSLYTHTISGLGQERLSGSRPAHWNHHQSVWMIIRALQLSALLLILCLGACDSRDPGGIRMGLASAPVNFDPRLATDAASARLNRLLYQRLVEFDERNKPVAGLTGWRRITPLHYRFELQPDAMPFSNGKPLDIADVEATLASILDTETGSPFRTQLDIIERMQTHGERGLDFHLKRPDPLFPARLALEILPADLIESGHAFSQQPVGNGPFLLAARHGSAHLSLTRRRDGRPVELLEVKDPAVRVMKLLRGEIDLLQNDLPPELFGLLQESAGIKVERRPGSNFSYLGFNLEDAHTGRLAVRRAVALAIDRQAIIEQVFLRSAEPAQALFTSRHWAGAKNLVGFNRDLSRARALLASAGYDEENPLELEYKTSSDSFRIRLASIIQAQLAEVGIRVKVRSLDWGTFFGDVKAGRFQMYSLTWVGVRTPDHFRYVFHSDSIPPNGANRGRYRSEQADQFIEQAENADTLEAQAELYRQLQALLLRDLPYVPLWYENQIVAGAKAIRGYELAADGAWDGLLNITRVSDSE